MKALITLWILLLLLTSCNSVQNFKTSSNSNRNTNDTEYTNNMIESSQIKDDTSSELSEEDKLVEKFVNSINNKDIDLLLQCVDSNDKNKEKLEKAVEYYNSYFDNSKIGSYKLIDKDNKGALKYLLEVDNGKKKVINITMSESQYIIGFDNFIRYSYYADEKMKSFIEALKTKDIKALSFNIWNSMEPIDSEGNLGIYPIYKAREVLDRYVHQFDLDTINITFTGNTTAQNGDGFFIYNITGTKGASSTEHKLIVRYGDGQVGISDDWIEAMYSNDLDTYDILNVENDTVIQ